jgi:hypothetical protein
MNALEPVMLLNSVGWGNCPGAQEGVRVPIAVYIRCVSECG